MRCLVAFLSCFASAAQETAAPIPGPGADKKVDVFRGELSTRLDAQRSNRDSNVMLEQHFTFTVKPAVHEKLQLRGGLWLLEDLDGHESADSSLSGLNNTFKHSVQLRPLHLYLQMEDTWGDSTLRVGRQRILEGPAYSRIDGAYFHKQLSHWDWYAFAGARASLYDGAHDDLNAGAGVGLDLTPTTRFTLDSVYAENDRRSSEAVRTLLPRGLFGIRFPREAASDVDTRVISAALHKRLAESHYLHAQYTVTDGVSDEYLVSVSGVFVGHEIAYDLTLRRQEQIIGDRANDVTGFYRVLGEQNEYTDASATVQFSVSERLTLGLEGQIRETESDDPATANRDFQRYAITLRADDLPHSVGFRASIEQWNVSGDEGTIAFTGDVSKSWDLWKLTAGADYERWEDRVVDYREYAAPAVRVIGRAAPFVRRSSGIIAALLDTDVVETHENVYMVYAETERKFGDSQKVSWRLSYEQDDGPDSPYWRFNATYRLRF